MRHKLEYAYFMASDGNTLTVEQRIQEALKLLQNDSDYLEFPDGKRCSNEHELRQTLKEKGGIL